MSENLFKSCDYCRHRKKRCLFTGSEKSICDHCRRCDIPCVFSRRSQSLKRKKVSQEIAAKVLLGQAKFAPLLVVSPENISVQSDGPDATNSLGASGSFASSSPPGLPDRATTDGLVISSDVSSETDEQHGENTVDTMIMYRKHVEPYTPFLPPHMEPVKCGAIFKCCMAIAANLSFKRKSVNPSTEQFQQMLNDMFDVSDINLEAAIGIMLLSHRIDIDPNAVEMKIVESDPPLYDTPLSMNEEESNDVPQYLLCSAVITDALYHFLHSSIPQTSHIASCAVSSVKSALDPKSFSYQYLTLCELLIRLHSRQTLDFEFASLDPLTRKHEKTEWLKLEDSCLFWPVPLSTHLTVVRDGLKVTPEALILHVYHNTILLSFYIYVLSRPNTLGKLLALKPIPGLLHLLCAMAKSNFQVGRDLIERWNSLADFQCLSANLILDLYEITGFENCKLVLSVWNDHGKFPEVYKRAQAIIGEGPSLVEEPDGYWVYWTFRDVRSLTLGVYLDDQDY